jgi:nucleoside-diphosphate-sugar epimerase
MNNKLIQRRTKKMRIFLTGASGFVGSAIIQELINSGHQVTGLARSDFAAEIIKSAGANVFRGDLEDLESLRKGATDSDGVIHAGFIHDFSKFKENCEIDRKAIETIGSVLEGSDRPLIITSGIALLSGKAVTEDDMPSPQSPNPRIATEDAALDVGTRGVNVSVVRLPPSVHGDGDHGFVPILGNLAREKGMAAYIGEGRNHWCAVHRLDAARLYKLALEKGEPNSYYHAVGDEGVEFRKIAEVIGKNLNIPAVSLTPGEAAAHFTWFAHFAAVDIQASSLKTRESLGWYPTQIGLIEDIDRPSYFEA